ncbi:MAG: Gfo/Idh/MocA family oxidoreductase [Nitrospirae bacterium]|nr:Gfo/Idh/MocA family oxidoreductase [Nitrospirota bacterium]
MAPLGIGLIGLGRHGMRYVRHLSDTPPDARLVAVCRRDTEQGRIVASQQGVKFFQDYGDLIAYPHVGAVVVATPPSLCLPICLAAVRAGKPLLIEKPLACTGADAREMVRAADAAGIPLMTAHTLRFDRAILALKSQLAAVGARRYLVLTNRVEPRPEVVRDPKDYGGRGVLLEIGIHLLDLVRFLTGEEVAEVRCEVERPSPKSAELRALASLRTTGGLPCIVDVSRMTRGRVSRAEWIGADGQLNADWVHHRVRKVSAGSVASEQTVEDVPTVEEVLRAFVGALARGGPMPVTGTDGQRAVEIADACYESAESGRVVRLVR